MCLGGGSCSCANDLLHHPLPWVRFWTSRATRALDICVTLRFAGHPLQRVPLQLRGGDFPDRTDIFARRVSHVTFPTGGTAPVVIAAYVGLSYMRTNHIMKPVSARLPDPYCLLVTSAQTATIETLNPGRCWLPSSSTARSLFHKSGSCLAHARP